MVWKPKLLALCMFRPQFQYPRACRKLWTSKDFLYFKGPLVVYFRRLGDAMTHFSPALQCWVSSNLLIATPNFHIWIYKRAFLSDKTKWNSNHWRKKKSWIAFIVAKAQERPSSSIPCRAPFPLRYAAIKRNSNRFFLFILDYRSKEDSNCRHGTDISSIRFNIFLLRNQHLPMIIIRNEQIKWKRWIRLNGKRWGKANTRINKSMWPNWIFDSFSVWSF